LRVANFRERRHGEVRRIYQPVEKSLYAPPEHL